MIAETSLIIASTAPLTARLNAASCLECGGTFAKAGTHGGFCSTGCRAAWNNRRLQRGAILYDLIMTLRFERKRARMLGVWTILCRAATLFRDADQVDRAGRRSWTDAADVLARRPYLHAKTMVKARPKDRVG